jgi:hypothetical protein
MADVLKFEQRRKARGEELPVALRRFIDAVIVPALVREYLAEKKSTNILASSNCCVTDSAANASLCEVPR